MAFQKSQGAFDDYGYSARLGLSGSPNFLSSQRPGQLAAPWNRVDHGLDDGGVPAKVDLGGIRRNKQADYDRRSSCPGLTLESGIEGQQLSGARACQFFGERQIETVRRAATAIAASDLLGAGNE